MLSHSRPQRPRSFWFLVLTKRSTTSGDENDVEYASLYFVEDYPSLTLSRRLLYCKQLVILFFSFFFFIAPTSRHLNSRCTVTFHGLVHHTVVQLGFKAFFLVTVNLHSGSSDGQCVMYRKRSLVVEYCL